MDETELKLTAADGATLDRVLRSDAVRDLDAGGGADGVHYFGLYYDTADDALERAALSLRARREGGQWRAAVKFAGRIENGLSRRREIETDIDGELKNAAQLPDGELKDKVLEVIAADAPLQVRVRVDMRRSIRNLQLDDAVRVELVADNCVIYGRRQQTTLYEIELELKSPPTPQAIASLTSFGEALARAFALTPSTRTKRGIGQALG